jgi:hypothetical protein
MLEILLDVMTEFIEVMRALSDPNRVNRATIRILPFSAGEMGTAATAIDGRRD